MERHAAVLVLAPRQATAVQDVDLIGLLNCLPPLLLPVPAFAYSDNRSDGQADQAYDVLTRELVFEAKAQPGDRTMTGGDWVGLDWVEGGANQGDVMPAERGGAVGGSAVVTCNA